MKTHSSKTPGTGLLKLVLNIKLFVAVLMLVIGLATQSYAASTTEWILIAVGEQRSLGTQAGAVWSSGDSAIATIDTTGALMGVAPGATSVVADLGNGDSLIYKVTVMPEGDFSVNAPALGQTTINVANYGVSSGNPDNTVAMQSAIDAARALNAPVKILIPQGTYHFSGTINLQGMSDLTFDGQGAEFVLDQILGTSFLKVDGCTRVQIVNLVLDWNWNTSRIASVVEVAEVFSPNQFDFRFIEVSDVDPAVAWVNLNQLDPASLAPGVDASNRDIYTLARTDVKKIAGNVLRVTFSQALSLSKGQVYLLRHYDYAQNAVFINDSSHVTLEQITLYSMPGMGLIANKSHHILVTGFRDVIRPSAGRRISTAADAIHFANNQGFIRIEDSEFHGMGDDAINIHDSNSTGLTRSANANEIVALNAATFNMPFGVGDVIEFRNSDLSPTGVFKTVSAATYNGNNTWNLTFDEAIPSFPDDTRVILYNRTYHSENIVIRGNFFHENRGRGILLMRGNALVERNRFFRTQGPAVRLDTFSSGQGEGTGATNVVFRDNSLEFCNVSQWGTNGSSLFARGKKFDGTSTNYGVFSNLTFTGNRFIGPAGGLYCLESVLGNKILSEEVVIDTPPFSSYRGVIVVKNSAGISIANNEWKASPYFENSISALIQIESTSVVDAVVANNAITTEGATELPATPSALNAQPDGGSSIELSWVDNADNEQSFLLERSTDNMAFTQIAVIGLNTVEYTDSNLAPQTTYYYRVGASNNVGSSDYSSVASATTLFSVLIDNADSAGVTITGSWTASTTTAGYYGGNYIHDGNSTSGGKSVKFTPALPMTGNYDVYVRWTAESNRAPSVPIDVNHAHGQTTLSVNQRANNGIWVLLGRFVLNQGTSGSVTIRNDGAAGYVVADAAEFVFAGPASSSPPSSPTDLAAFVGDDYLALTWAASVDASTYRIKRASSVSGPFTVIADNVPVTSYIDTSAAPGSTNYYVVSAVNSIGESGDTEVVGGTLGYVIDNAHSAGVEKLGTWTVSTFGSGYLGADYLHDGNSGGVGGKSVTFRPTLSTSGDYDVYVRWTSLGNRATNATIDVNHDGGVTTQSVNQQINGGTWYHLGRFDLSAGTANHVRVRNDGANGYVIADAAKFVQYIAPPAMANNATAMSYYGMPLSYSVAATNSPWRYTAQGLPTGLTINSASGVISGSAPVGSYTVTIQATNNGGTVTSTLMVVIAKTPAEVVLANLKQAYDGTAKVVSALTIPGDLPVQVLYGGSSIAPIYPGIYAVTAQIVDPNYQGGATGTIEITPTAIVRHSPVINGIVDGSVWLLSPESLAFNSSTAISGDFLVPGTPMVQLNGAPIFGGTIDGPGAPGATNYTVTLNAGATLRHLIRRIHTGSLPEVPVVQSPTGTRDVVVNQEGENVGDFATIRSLTLNSHAGAISLPEGVYGNLTANDSAAFVLGVAGGTQTTVYQIQRLTLNGTAALHVIGPVILRVQNGVVVNGVAGSSVDPSWLHLEIHQGEFVLNSGAVFSGHVLAPNSQVTINGMVIGSVISDRLTINGSGELAEPN